MTPEQFQQRLQKLMTDLPTKVDEQIATAGNNFRALVTRRINLSGVDADGNKFPAYTPAYDKYKTKKGRNVGFRNLSLSGSMLQNFRTYKEGNEYVLGFRDGKELKKAEGNSDYVGINIIKPSDDEVKTVEAAFNKAILKFINETLGQ